MVRRILLLSVVLTVVPWVAAVSPAVAATPTSTAFDVVFQAAHPDTQQSGSTFFAADADVNVYSRSRRTLILDDYHGQDNSQVLSLTAPTSGPFTAGVTYPVAKRADATHATAAIYPLGCGTPTAGTLTFTAVGFAGATVASADGTYDIQCAAGSVRGFFHVRTTTPWNAVIGRNYTYGIPDPRLGSSASVTTTFEAVGTTPSAPRTVSLAGTGAPDATITTDTCTGQTLPVGAVCTVTLALRLLTTGLRDLVVQLGDARSELTYGVYDPVVGTYYSAPAPVRVLDTRTATGSLGGKLVAGTTKYLNLDALPIRASAVVLNVTAVDPTAPGYLKVAEYGTASSVNFVAGQTVANLVTVPTQYNRTVLSTSAGAVDVVVDLLGWYAADGSVPAGVGRGGGFHPTTPARVLDTRTWTRGRLAPGARAVVPIHVATVDAHVRAVDVTVTTTNVTAPGYLTAFDAGSTSVPATSTLNLTAGATTSNAAVVPITACDCTTDHAVAVVNRSTAPVDVLVDVTGWFDDGLVPADIRFAPRVDQPRIADSRSGSGFASFGTGTAQNLTPPAATTDYDTVALSTNITTVAPTAPTYLTVWPTGSPRPSTSLVNAAPGAVVASHLDIAVGTSGGIDVFNHAGRNDVVVDLQGTFERFPGTPTDEQTSTPAPVTLSHIVAGPVAPYPVG